MTPTSGRMRTWAPLGAAVVVLAVLVLAYLVTRPGAPELDAGANGAPGATDTPGWRAVSYRDVVVEVPDSWGWGHAPGSDWCAGDGRSSFPEEPYVDVSRPSDVVSAIGCLGEVPERYNVTHLAFSDPGSELQRSAQTGSDWFPTSRQVGAAVVTVWSDQEHGELAQQIVDTARVVATDPNGCSVSSSIQAGHFVRPPAPFRVEDLSSVDAISVCQYALGAVDVPGLLASHRMTGAEANDVLDAIQAAPAGGGPDAPQQCIADSFGDMALVLRLVAGAEQHDMYVYMQSCRGNGFDDGTTLRELTAEGCRPLWRTPVRMTWGHSESFARCQD